jgi:hypothetical protein
MKFYKVSGFNESGDRQEFFNPDIVMAEIVRDDMIREGYKVEFEEFDT